jgi:hypothetical protein
VWLGPDRSATTYWVHQGELLNFVGMVPAREAAEEQRDGLRWLRATARGGQDGPVVLHLHGGGYLVGSPEASAWRAGWRARSAAPASSLDTAGRPSIRSRLRSRTLSPRTSVCSAAARMPGGS